MSRGKSTTTRQAFKITLPPQAPCIADDAFEHGPPTITLRASQRQLIKFLQDTFRNDEPPPAVDANFSEGLDDRYAARSWRGRFTYVGKVTFSGTPVLCLSNPTGTGKTHVALGLAAAGNFPTETRGTIDLDTVTILSARIWRRDQLHFEGMQELPPDVPPVVPQYLFVVPNRLMVQYRREVQKWSSLRVNFIGTRKDVDAAHDLTGTEHTATILSDTMFNNFFNPMRSRQFRFQRWAVIVFDELHDTSTYLTANLPEAGAYLLLNATPNQLHRRSTKGGDIIRAFLGPRRNLHPLQVQSDPTLLQNELALPRQHRWFIECQTIGLLPLERGLLRGEEDFRRLMANAVSLPVLLWEIILEKKSELVAAGERAVTEKALLEYRLRENKDFPIDRLRLARETIADCDRREDALRQELRQLETTLRERSDSTSCPVCLEEYGPAANRSRSCVILSCSHRVCATCSEKLIAAAVEECYLLKCPTCRMEIAWNDPKGIRQLLMVRGEAVSPGNLSSSSSSSSSSSYLSNSNMWNGAVEARMSLASMNENVEAEHRRLHSKLEVLMYFLRLSVLGQVGTRISAENVAARQMAQFLHAYPRTDLRFLIVAKYDVTMDRLGSRLEDEAIPFCRIGGGGIASKLNDLASGKCRVVLMQTDLNASGLDGLQHVCPHWIFVEYHRLEECERTQALGRVVRHVGEEEVENHAVTTLTLYQAGEYDGELVEAEKVKFDAHMDARTEGGWQDRTGAPGSAGQGRKRQRVE